MTDMNVALRLQVEGAQGWVSAVRSLRQEMGAAAQASSGSARAFADASGALSEAAPAAQGAARSVGRLRDETGKFLRSGSEAAGAARSAAAGFAQAGSAAGSAAGGVGSLRGALAQIAGSVRSANDSVGGLVSNLRGLGAVVVGGFALDQIKDFGGSVIQAAAAYETLQTRLEFVAGSQAAANEEMARARAMADQMAVSERAVLDVRARLLPLEQAGAVSRRNSLALTAGLIDATKALGASQEELESVMYGLGQALSQEIVRAEEFNQVTEPLPGITLKLDRAIQSMTGNASANFRSMVNDGKVTRELFATALVKALEDFEGAGEKSADTIDGALINLSNNWERLKRSLIETEPVVRALDAVAGAMGRVTNAIAPPERIIDPVQSRIDAIKAELEARPPRTGGATPYIFADGGPAGSGGPRAAQRPSAFMEGVLAVGAAPPPAARVDGQEEALRRELATLAQRQADLAMRAVDEAALDATRRGLEAQAAKDRTTTGLLAGFVSQGEAQRRAEQLKKLDDLERQAKDLRDREITDLAAYAETIARIEEEREKLRPKPASQTQPRDLAAEAKADLDHAQAMLAAAELEGEAARRKEEIRLLSEREARRSGHAEGTPQFEAIREAAAEEMAVEDRRKAVEDARRKAAQDAEAADREARRKDAEALRDQESALKKIADLDAEAAVAAAGLGAARQAATEAATATTLEGLAEIEARAEAAKRRLAVKEAGDKAYESLEKGATEDQRKDARAQAEATELAKQQAEAEERRLQITGTLLGLRLEESRGAEAAARAAGTARAAVGAQSLAEIAALEAQGEAAARLAETDRKAQEARLSLGAEAGKTERDAAEAAVRGLAAQEEALRLAGEELSRRREIVGLQGRAAEAAERGALAERTASAALDAGSRAEVSRVQTQGEIEARAAETERAVKAARESLGPEASDPEKREAEAAVRAEAAAKEQERLGGLLIAQAQTLADLRERGAEAEGRVAVSLRQAAAAAGARSTLELEAARKTAEAETRALERAERIRKAGEALGPEADPARLAEAESLAAAEWDRAEAARRAGEAVEKRAALLRFEEAAADRLKDIEIQRSAYLSASGPAEERARAAQVELTAQQRIREAKAQQLDHDEAQIRAGAEREASAARELDLIQRRGAALEELERRRREAEEDAAAARQGPAAVSALAIRRAGEEAARPLGGDPGVASAAEAAVRAERAAQSAQAVAALEREAGAVLRLAEARRQGVRALVEEQIRQKGAEAAESHAGDPDVAAAAMRAERTRLHASALEDLQERLKGLQTPYEQALEAADRWREGALANLDPMAAGYREFAAEVDQIHVQLYEDALQHSTLWADGVKRSLRELREANEDWAKISEDAVKGFNAEGKNAFVDLVKTGKLEVGSFADFIKEKLAEIAWQKTAEPGVNALAGGFADLLGGVLGGGKGSAKASAKGGGFLGAIGSAIGGLFGFDAGGFTGEGGKYEPAGIVHRGEVVWSQDDVARHGGASLVDAMRQADPLAAAAIMTRAAERGGARGYAEGGIVGARAPVFAAPPAAQVEALTRASAQSAPAPAAVNVVIVNQTSTPVRQETRQRPDGTLEIRLMEAARAAVAQDIASGSGPVSGALQSRYQLAQNFGGRR